MTTDNPSDEQSYAVVANYSGDTSPSLEPAVLRLQRAVRRLNDVRDIIELLKARADADPLEVSISKANVEAGVWADPHLRWNHDIFDFGNHQELRVLTGEVLYHLRTALEYVAYHLVWHDRGIPFDRSKFPMVPVGKASEWPKTAKRNLPGLTPANLERIRLLQPCAGCDWTAELSLLSNIDKHRSPIKVGVATGATFSIREIEVVPDPDDADRYIVQSAPTLDVRTHDGKPLHETLIRLCGSVNEALQTFSGVLPGPKPK